MPLLPCLVADGRNMTGSPHLRLFGFPIFFRPSILVVTAIAVYFLGGLGLILAATLAVSILVHELGHSFAFRQFGTESHIVVHLFGGYSSPDFGNKLNHREWVITSFAGPGLAFFLLGLPAWLLREFNVVEYGYTELIVRVLIWFNVYWGIANLAPIWPLDGGRVLYHMSEGNWPLTKACTLVLSVPAVFIAYQLGYRFAAIFIVFNAFQVMNSAGPSSVGRGGNSRISAAAKEAKAYAAKPTKTRGAAGDQAIERVYRELLRGRPDRAAEPLDALRGSKHKAAADLASAWGELLAGNPVSAGATRTPLLTAVENKNGLDAASALRGQEIAYDCVPALVVLQRDSILEQTCASLVADTAGQQKLRQLERLALDYGLVDEQMQVTGALDIS